uniref:Putative homing endonuclease n=1 Tax=viral metagenome TaxID=1070528 RepID=A0A6M3XGI6_9ZZZZ
MITSHGYEKIYIGIGDYRADSKGYAYVHRLIAEKILGRSLRKGEEVHHIDGNRSNNAESNIVVLPSRKIHQFEHRTTSHLREPLEPNTLICCACGCGAKFLKYDNAGRPRYFINGHNIPTKERPFCACGCRQRVKHIKSKYKANHGSKAYRNEKVFCMCGCGIEFVRYDKHGRERKYIIGHARRLK